MKQYPAHTVTEREREQQPVEMKRSLPLERELYWNFVCAFSLIDNYVREGLIGLSNGL